jgi:hypothetical protein
MNVRYSDRASTVNGRIRRRAAPIMAVMTVLLGILAAVASPGATRAQDSWEYTPYRIRVWLAVRPSAAVSATLREDVLRTLEVLAPVYGGATWRLKAEVAPETIGSSMLAVLDDLTVEQVGAVAADALSQDKLMLLCIREDQGRFVVTCRELDCTTRTLGRTVRMDSWQRVLLPRAAVDAIAESFQPLVRVESSRGKKATVRIRAGGLVRDEHCPSAIRGGDVLRPVIRRNDRRGEPKPGGIQVLDWTYLVVREAKEYLLDCDVYSAMRNPLAGRSSSTVERMALKVRPRGGRTTLQLVARGESPDPLEGYEIFAKKPVAGDGTESNPSLRLGLTDWRGMIDIEQSDLPLRLIYVKNGAHLVARIPVVPGYQPLETVPLPSDDKRLEAEAFVKGMESTVMDLVARREILADRIRRRIAEGKTDQARELLDEIKSFQTKEDLEMMLASRQSALASPDKRQQQRIDQLLTGTRSLLNKYLNPEQLVALEREVGGSVQSPRPVTPESTGAESAAK